MEEHRNKKRNLIIAIITIIIYTIIVVQVTIKLYTNILNKAFQNVNIDLESDNISSNEDISTTTDNNNLFNISISHSDSNDTPTVANKIALNDIVSKESKYEFSVIGYDFAKKILPPNTSGYYSYYEAKEDGHQYLDIKLNYKNLDSTEIDADEVGSIKIKFANNYEYTSFSIIEKADGNFTYSSITSISPLTIGKLHYLFDIPDEVANSTESIVAYITIGSEKYELTIR